MALELVAGRLIARQLGSSLYTWTSVIGVVLTGITIGYYIGGRIADRFDATKALALLLAMCSVTCVAVIILSNLLSNWKVFWHLALPLQAGAYVAVMFLTPSVLLGSISPIVAKRALERGLPTGRTVGDIYAWGAAGSIAGTFLAGFYLIAAMGTRPLIWAIAAILLLAAILYGPRLWGMYGWGLVLLLLIVIANVSASWAQNLAAAVALQGKANPRTIYEDETPYCYVSVRQESAQPDVRSFIQDRLTHSIIVMGDITDLQYSYEQIHAAVTHSLAETQRDIAALVIGGGGFVFPRYLTKMWPNSRVDVAEIDPGVTEAAFAAFGLQRDTPIEILTMDARNHITQLIHQQQIGENVRRYDFIYEDALNDLSIPYQLTTKQFNDQIYEVLSETGVYMVELIDSYEVGRFAGAFVNTVRQTFAHVYVICESHPTAFRSTFVIIASKRQIDIEKIRSQPIVAKLDLWPLTDTDIETLVEKSGHMILTDDYAPVDNLLAAVAKRREIYALAEVYNSEAAELKEQGKFAKAISKYRKIIELDPAMSVVSLNEIGMLLLKMGKTEQAAEALSGAIAYNETQKIKLNVAAIHYNLAITLRGVNRHDEANNHFVQAISGFEEQLNKDPGSLETLTRLGNIFAETGEFRKAAEYFRKAIQVDPYYVDNHDSLARALEFQGLYDEAVNELRKSIVFFSEQNLREQVEFLLTTLKTIEMRKQLQETDK